MNRTTPPGVHLSRAVLVVTIAFIVVALRTTSAPAQTCGTEYILKEGETLTQIAARVYGNAAQWNVIFYANQDRLGGSESLLVPGISLRVPCIGGSQLPLPQIATTPVQAPTGEPAFIISALLHRIEFLTADGFAPYTGRSLEGGGMLTQVISAAMGLIKEEAKGRFDYGISWVNDWSAHLNPLLLTRAFDVGFPWTRPDCDSVAELDQSSQFRCQKFLFSDPLYEAVTSLFVLKTSRLRTLRTEELAGTTLCLPTGNPTHDLDQAGRNWVKGGKVELVRQSVDECFRLLDKGTVDGVVEAELVGRATASTLNLSDRVRVIEEPVALTTYHALVSKTHPQARIILYYVNSSLAKLRENGEYDRIIERHLARFFEALPSVATPASDAESADQTKGSLGAARSASPEATPVKGKGEDPKETSP